jgi:hypothetical protein
MLTDADVCWRMLTPECSLLLQGLRAGICVFACACACACVCVCVCVFACACACACVRGGGGGGDYF